MLTLLILGIIVFVVLKNLEDFWAVSFFSLFFGCLIFLGVTLVLETSSGLKEKSREDCSCPIYSLRDGSSISGHFCLGSGFVASQEEYSYYCKNSRGGYQRCAVAATNAAIFMQDGEPTLRWQIVHSVWPKWFSFWSPDFASKTSYELIVPKGTIIEKFEVK